jgi:hypothetical protein
MLATKHAKVRRLGLLSPAVTCKVYGLIIYRNGMEVSLLASQPIDNRVGTFQVSLISGEKAVA